MAFKARAVASRGLNQGVTSPTPFLGADSSSISPLPADEAWVSIVWSWANYETWRVAAATNNNLDPIALLSLAHPMYV